MSRIGLTRRGGPSSRLLQTIGNRPPQDAAPIRGKPEQRRASPDIHDAPLSSDEELPDRDNQLPGESKAKLRSRSPVDSSTPRQNVSSQSSIGRRSARKITGSSSSPKRSRREQENEGLDQAQDDFEFLRSSQGAKRSKRANCYGNRNIHTSSQEGRAKPSQGQGGAKMTKTDSHGFRNPPSEQDLESKLAGSSQSVEFRCPELGLEALESLSEEGQSHFKLPPEILTEEPLSSNPLGGTRRSARSRGEHPSDRPWRDVGMLAEDILSRPSNGVSPLLENGVSSISTFSSSAPSAGLSRTTLSDTSSLSPPPDSPASGISEEFGFATSSPRRSSSAFEVKCPICKEVVEQEFLESFSGGARMNVRKQASFCRAHKTESAKTEWSKRKYPVIDWTELPKRFKQFYPHLRDILLGKEKSFYRNVLEANVKTGKNRTLQQSLLTQGFTTLTPGYYGSRGAQVMMESIMSEFSSQMRKLAASDRLISSGGVSGFVQAVLVPELAVSLVKEDMVVEDDEKARTILKDSIEMGDLLNEEDDGDGTGAAVAKPRAKVVDLS
ncbi:MAG: hypothetical protein M1837_002224 [Sclerophora amabilis]|nr:MAG: hypothetical protein M1837_002224 [Sclerophora amabilis]